MIRIAVINIKIFQVLKQEVASSLKVKNHSNFTTRYQTRVFESDLIL